MKNKLGLACHTDKGGVYPALTILFENDENKYYIPVETCGSINVYSNVTFSTSFLECMNRKRLNVNVFDRYGEYLGGFSVASHYESGKTLLKQAQIYNDEKRSLEIAKSIELASLHNQRENLRYYNKHQKKEELQSAIK